MKDIIRRLLGILFDLRVIVGVCGVVLSVVMHELFHVIVHWGEIRSITLFPDTKAIVEVILSPSTDYDLVIEEAIAYTITMVTLILTAMLISDIHEARDKRSVGQIILTKDTNDRYSDTQKKEFLKRLAKLLGVKKA